jgi:hypothetical protein
MYQSTLGAGDLYRSIRDWPYPLLKLLFVLAERPSSRAERRIFEACRGSTTKLAVSSDHWVIRSPGRVQTATTRR